MLPECCEESAALWESARTLQMAVGGQGWVAADSVWGLGADKGAVCW